MSITYWFKPYQTALTDLTYLITKTNKKKTQKKGISKASKYQQKWS
jgi:hypothetical protein